METVVKCPVCGHANPAGSSRCTECWSRLADSVVLTQYEANELDGKWRSAGRRRWLLRWSLVTVIALSVGGWIAYQKVAAPLFVAPPVSDISSSPGPGDWPMALRDPGHRSVVKDGPTVLAGKLKWRFETDEPIYSSPAVVGGRVYLSTGDGRVLSLDGDSGELIWQREVNGPVNSSPAVAGDFVYAGLRDGRVLALHKDTGELRWEFGTGGAEYSSPVVYRGVLYVGSGDHKLYALDAVTGEERWSHVADSRIVSDPAVNEEVVAVVSLEGKLYILDAETGGRRLDFLTSATGGSPVFDEDWVWVAGQRGVVTAVDWRKRARPFEGLARRIRVQLFAWGMVGTVPPQKGFAWEAWQAGQSFVGTPVVDDGKVYVGSTSGALHALDRVTGEAIWTFHGDSKSLVSPSLAGNTVLVGDVEGRLYAVSAATGDELWRFNTGGRISSTPVIANGMLYVASWDGRLYAIE